MQRHTGKCWGSFDRDQANLDGKRVSRLIGFGKPFETINWRKQPRGKAVAAEAGAVGVGNHATRSRRTLPHVHLYMSHLAADRRTRR